LRKNTDDLDLIPSVLPPLTNLDAEATKTCLSENVSQEQSPIFIHVMAPWTSNQCLYLWTLRACSPGNICRKTLPNCLHHYLKILKPERRPGGSSIKMKVPLRWKHLLTAPHDSKAARSTPPYPPHWEKN